MVKVAWVNPHTWIPSEIEKDEGTEKVGVVEGARPNVWLRRELRRDRLEPGTEIIPHGEELLKSRREQGRC